MDAEGKVLLAAANEKTQYDTYAKKLLSEKCILAYILTATVEEFRGMSPGEAEGYIEGDPFVGSVPVSSGLTNAELKMNGQRIVGLNTVQGETLEGLAIFDILFYVRMKDGISRMIINAEAQKDEPSGYDILNRAIFYVSRLVSSQRERDFTGMHYNDLKRVYSIWVCMNMGEPSWDYVHLTDEPLLGRHHWKGKLDLLNIVLLGVPNEVPEQDSCYKLHRLLSTLFGVGLSAEERIGILENEYAIDARTEFGEEFEEMCNLSQGIWEQGIEQGVGRGELRKLIEQCCRKLVKGRSNEEIADALECGLSQINGIVNVARGYAPDYDVDKILEELCRV